MKNTARLLCACIYVTTGVTAYPMLDEYELPLLAMGAVYDVKEPIDDRRASVPMAPAYGAPTALSIDIKTPENPMLSNQRSPDYAAVAVACPEPLTYARNSKNAKQSSARYLSCTKLPKDMKILIASYLSDQWLCAAMLNSGEKQHDAVIAPDGTYFITSATTLKLWDQSLKPEILYHLNGIEKHNNFVFIDPVDYKQFSKITFSPNGTYFAAARQSNNLIRTDNWNNNICVCIKTVDALIPLFTCVLPDYTSEATDIAFSPDNKYLAVASNKNALDLWDLTGNCVATWQIPTDQSPQQNAHDTILPLIDRKNAVTSIAFHPDSKHIAYTTYKAVNLLPIESIDRTNNISCCRLPDNPHSNNLLPGEYQNLFDHAIICAAFTPDGKKLVAGSYDLLLIWDLHSNRFNVYPNRSQHASYSMLVNNPYRLNGNQIMVHAHANTPNKWLRSIICTKNKIIYAVDTKIHVLLNCFPDFTKHHEIILDNHPEPIARLSLSKNNILLALTQTGILKKWASTADIIEYDIPQSSNLNYQPEEIKTKLSVCDSIKRCQLRYSILIWRVGGLCLLGICITFLVVLFKVEAGQEKHG